MDIVDEIKIKLNEIEKQYDVEILFAIESGSRAWGFESPDSDYDVRFVYKSKPKFYLQLNKRRDVIEYMLDEVYDINGWDLDKTLKLLHSSNPTLFEWVNSPIAYKTSAFHTSFKKIISAYFMSKSGLFHYLSMAEGNYREYLKGENVKLKKYLYVIRPLLACRWILANNSPPPMLFSELVSGCMEPELHEEIGHLLELKMAASEKKASKRITPLNDWIEANLDKIKASISLLPADNKKDFNELNKLFIKELGLE